MNFSIRISTSLPGDFVLVANHCKNNLKDQKVKFRWIGPAQDRRDAWSLFGEPFGTFMVLKIPLTKNGPKVIHTSRLAPFYSHEMEGVTDEVRIQILHDNNQFVIRILSPSSILQIVVVMV